VKNRSIGGYKTPRPIDLTLPFQYDENGCILAKDKPIMVFHSRSRTNKNEGGQSFVELSLVVIFLMIFVAGVVEFGFMLNNYLNLVDASREAVRYSADSDPFIRDDLGEIVLDAGGNKLVNDLFFEQTDTLTREVLAPVELDETVGDDIVVSFFSVGKDVLGNDVFIRYPLDKQGWSANGNQVSKLSNAEVRDRVDFTAPPTGVLLVEIFYHYNQILKLPVFTVFVRDPMPVYAYAVMPLTAAEP
jgi:hypothetical protein